MAKGKQKIRIKLKAYDVSLLDQSARKIVETAKRSGAEVSGPIPLPVKNHLICVLRSPFIDKKSREHFHILTHKRVVDITKPTQNTVDALMGLELPSGVDAEIKTS